MYIYNTIYIIYPYILYPYHISVSCLAVKSQHPWHNCHLLHALIREAQEAQAAGPWRGCHQLWVTTDTLTLCQKLLDTQNGMFNDDQWWSMMIIHLHNVQCFANVDKQLPFFPIVWTDFLWSNPPSREFMALDTEKVQPTSTFSWEELQST